MWETFKVRRKPAVTVECQQAVCDRRRLVIGLSIID